MVERCLGIRESVPLPDNYFLKSGVFFVQGALNGAIYDINTSNVYSINKEGCNILNGISDNKIFVENLQSLGLVSTEIEEKSQFLNELSKESTLQFVWFEIISDDCNESCIHCYAECMPPTYRKNCGIFSEKSSNNGRSRNSEKISYKKWIQLIDESYTLGCRSCQFIGGEPMLYKGENNETVFDLVEHARDVGFEFIEIFTNGTLLSKEKIQKIEKLGLNVAISLYSNNESIHDSITKTPGSFRKTLEALKLLREANIPVRVETVLMHLNEDTINETQKFVKEMGFYHKQPDVLRPNGRGENPSIMPTQETIVKYSLMLSPSFSITKDILSRNVSGHPCLLGKITITDNGNVLPCIFSRGMVAGNVQKMTLAQVVSGNDLKLVWESTKDNVLVCQVCEYRYACFDCRPLSEGASHGSGQYLTAPYPRCTYNPYTGEWAKGIWKVNEKGETYYDDALLSIINDVRQKGGEKNESGTT